MIMEYLLINHPLDCPVCDQAGECGLQDYSYEYGQATHRFVEERTVNPRKDVSDLIQLNQDRCIMCTRCVRFTREITQTGELQVMRRGNHAEIDIFPGHPVDNPLAGNVVDLCPVGALLDKDFLHKQRVWFLSKHDAVCTRCSTGCNISAEENRGAALAVQAAVQPARQRLLDLRRGPLQLQGGQRPRPALPRMYVRKDGDLEPVADRPGAQGRRPRARRGRRAGRDRRRRPLAVPDGRGSVPDGLVPQGPEPGERAGARARCRSRGEDQTFTPDQTKGRTGDTSFVVPRPFTIHAEKCPNRRGVEAVLEHFQGEVIDFDDDSAAGRRGRVPGALRRLGRDRPLDRRGRGRGAPAEGRVPGRPGHERHAAGPAGRRGARRGDVRREGRLLRQRRRPAPVLRGRPAAARRLAARPRPLRDPARPRRRPDLARARSSPSWPEPSPAFAVAGRGQGPRVRHPARRGRPAEPTGAAAAPFADPWTSRRARHWRSSSASACRKARRISLIASTNRCVSRILTRNRIDAGADRHPDQDPDRGGHHPGGGRVPDPGRAEGRGLRAGPDRAEPCGPRVRHPVRPAPAAGRRRQDAPQGGRDPALRRPSRSTSWRR